MAREVDRWSAFVGVVGDEYRLDPRGEWVRFEDHERLVRALEAEIKRLAPPTHLFDKKCHRFHAGD